MPTPLTIINEIKTRVPVIDFDGIKNAALGKDYTLNLIFTDSAHIEKLNTIYRGKKCPTDILSFPLSETEGEIYISPVEAAAEAKKFDRPYDNFIGFLFIHGCTHLKGHDHGSIMEDVESQIRAKFKI
jgi:rRNA maturation RNase YbeY